MLKNIIFIYQLLIFIFIIIDTKFSIAEVVYIEADLEQGQGIVRNRGNECYVITAGHVVKDLSDYGESRIITFDKTIYQ